MYGLNILVELRNAGLTSIFHPRKLHLARINPFPEQLLPLDPPSFIRADKAEAHEESKFLKIIHRQQTKSSGYKTPPF